MSNEQLSEGDDIPGLTSWTKCFVPIRAYFLFVGKIYCTFTSSLTERGRDNEKRSNSNSTLLHVIPALFSSHPSSFPSLQLPTPRKLHCSPVAHAPGDPSARPHAARGADGASVNGTRSNSLAGPVFERCSGSGEQQCLMALYIPGLAS